MTTKAQALYDVLLKRGTSPRSYSGRGMFGEYCIGTTEFPTGKAVTIAGRPCTDSLGRGTIYYWPSMKWDDATMQEKEDE